MLDNLLMSILTSSTVLFALQKIFEKSLIAKIIEGFKHEYAIELEKFKIDNGNRQKAAMIADLLSEWASDKPDNVKLNRLSFEGFIWLPKDIALKLSLRLSNHSSAPEAKEIIADVRKLLLGNEQAIDPSCIIHFPRESKVQ